MAQAFYSSLPITQQGYQIEFPVNNRFEISGNGNVSDLLRREEYNLLSKFETVYKINADKGYIEIPTSGLGTISKIMVITSKDTSARLRFSVEETFDPKYNSVIEFSEFTYMSISSTWSKFITKLELATSSIDIISVDIRIYSFDLPNPLTV